MAADHEVEMAKGPVAENVLGGLTAQMALEHGGKDLTGSGRDGVIEHARPPVP